jgi:2-polyprenyl-3-methyl-5-hydroxy-6-metoxy-1,4-benzoquinol methylase
MLTADSLPDIDSGNTNLELLFCTEVLGLPSLHYGYWLDGEELTLENLRLAQERYTCQIVSSVPCAGQRVLDVGCGTGDIARALAARGHHITAISPDPAHRKMVDAAAARITYLTSRFEDLDIDQTFDVILMAESQNYLEPSLTFRQSQRYLREGGHLLVSGIFGRADVPTADLPSFVGNVDDEFIARARQHGFQLVWSEDITAQVLPTLDFCRETYNRYVAPTIRIAALWLERRPMMAALVRLALKKDLRSLTRVESYYVARFDASLFARTCRYLTCLFVHGKA